MIRGLIRFLAAGLLLLLLLPSTSSAQTTSTTHQLKVVNQTAFIGPNGTFSVEVSTGDLPATTKLDLIIYGAVTTRSRLDRTIAGEQLGSALFSTPTTALEPNRTTTVLSLPIKDRWPAPEGGTVLSQSGVHPVVIEATTANGSRIDSIVTHLLRLPDATAPTTPLSVATTVIVDAPVQVGPEGTPRYTDAQLDRASEQFSLLSTFAPIPHTLAATPFLVQALAESGSGSARPDTENRQTLSRPFVSIDAGALVAAGRASILTEEFLTGDRVLGSVFESVPDHRTMLLDPTVTPSALDQVASLGTRSVVVQSSQIRSSLVGEGTAVLTNRFIIESGDGTAFSAIANDDSASARFVLTADSILGAHHALAELMVIHEEQPGPDRGIALSIPADTDIAALKEFLGGLASATGATSGSIGAAVIQPVTLDDLFNRVAVATASQKPIIREWTSEEPPDLGSYAVLLEQEQWNLLGLRSMLPDGADLIDPIERTMLASAASNLTPDARVAIIGNTNAQLTAVTSAISLPDAQTVTLTSSSGRIPLVITNELPIEARVRVAVSSPKLQFPEGTVYEVVLAPSSTTRTDIAVTTKASGAFPLDVSVASSGGGLAVTSSRIDVRSTAISGFGLFLSIGAGLFLLVWWGRHFRHTRRARALVTENETSRTTDG